MRQARGLAHHASAGTVVHCAKPPGRSCLKHGSRPAEPGAHATSRHVRCPVRPACAELSEHAPSTQWITSKPTVFSPYEHLGAPTSVRRPGGGARSAAPSSAALGWARAARFVPLTHGALSERSAHSARSELRRASPRRAAQGNRPEGPVAATRAPPPERLTRSAAPRRTTEQRFNRAPAWPTSPAPCGTAATRTPPPPPTADSPPDTPP